MGVSGAGKTTLGSALARLRRVPFIDADDLHPEANRRRMEDGFPLSDADREPWLESVGRTIAELTTQGSAPIVACSALKSTYRDMLRASSDDLAFIYLHGERATLEDRLRGREHEYMPAALLSSQLETLEAPHDEARVLEIDIALEPSEAVARAAEWLATLDEASAPLERTV